MWLMLLCSLASKPTCKWGPTEDRSFHLHLQQQSSVNQLSASNLPGAAGPNKALGLPGGKEVCKSVSDYPWEKDNRVKGVTELPPHSSARRQWESALHL